MNTTTRPGTATSSDVGTRDRIVRTAARLMQRQGYDGTGIKQIAQEAEATHGSVYHFFPGGKQELAVAAIRHGDEEFAAALRDVFERYEDPAEAVMACARLLADGLRDSDWVGGCPVASTALGASARVADIREAACTAFNHWQDLVFTALRRAGIPEDNALDLGQTVISALEGAELAAEFARDDAPLQAAGRHLARLIDLYRREAATS
ncbi:TetR/AcrR family transcriptional regulator [Spirillospora sp. CA-253888]